MKSLSIFRTLVVCIVSVVTFSTDFVGAAQFLPATDFYRAPISPDAMKLDGDIVITTPLMRSLIAKRANLRAYLVVDLNRIAPARFFSLLKREYGLKARFGTEFMYGLQEIEVVGASTELLRFLSNRYAQASVLWAGKSSGVRYVESVAPFYGDSSSGDYITDKSRAHLEPFPSTGEPDRRWPDYEYPDRGTEDPGTPAFLE